MAKIRIVGDSSGYVELAAPNAAGNNTLELPSGSKLVGADANNNVNLSGIITATGGFSGNLTGNVNSTGVTTVTELRVGTAVTISGGIVTATSFRGDGSQLTGIAATTNVVTNSLVVSGITTATGGIQVGATTSVIIGNTTIRSNSVGIGTTNTTGRNAGVGTAAGTVIYNSTNSAFEGFDGTNWSFVGGKTSAFHVYLGSTQSVAIADSQTPTYADVVVQFNTRSVDLLSEFNTSNYRFYPTYSGYYFLGATLAWQGNNSISSGGEMVAGFRKNGTNTIAAHFSRTFSAGAYAERGVYQTWTWVGYLAAGDYVETVWYQRSGQTLVLTSSNYNAVTGGTIGGAREISNFHGFRIA